MRTLIRLAVLAVTVWLVWCPVAFALPMLAAPSCHHSQQQPAMDCCQPAVPAPAPAMQDTAPASSFLPPGDVPSVAPTFATQVSAAPIPAAAPPAGWGRLCLSLSVLLN